MVLHELLLLLNHHHLVPFHLRSGALALCELFCGLEKQTYRLAHVGFGDLEILSKLGKIACI